MSAIPTIEITQAIVTRDHQPAGIFVLHCKMPLSELQARRFHAAWDVVWQREGYHSPGLILLDAGWELTALNDAELRKVGLIRVPDAK